MNKVNSHLKTWWYLYALGVFVIGIIIFGITGINYSHGIQQRFDDKCISQGNHPMHGRGLMICVTPDGRIVEG